VCNLWQGRPWRFLRATALSFVVKLTVPGDSERRQTGRDPSRLVMRKIVVLLWAFSALGLTAAQTVEIDPAASRVTVRVYKSGFFSAFAHDHTIAAPLASGRLDPAQRSVELRFKTQEMKVLDPGVSDSERAEIERTMKSDKILDIERFPEITFVSSAVESSAADLYRVRGQLALHGTTQPVDLPVSFSRGHYSGSVKLKQTDFGITPIRLAGGTVKVKDVIEIIFDIVPVAGNQRAAAVSDQVSIPIHALTGNRQLRTDNCFFVPTRPKFPLRPSSCGRCVEGLRILTPERSSCPPTLAYHTRQALARTIGCPA
jgi:polyisoprenoid-binding protein YceI